MARVAKSKVRQPPPLLFGGGGSFTPEQQAANRASNDVVVAAMFDKIRAAVAREEAAEAARVIYAFEPEVWERGIQHGLDRWKNAKASGKRGYMSDDYCATRHYSTRRENPKIDKYPWCQFPTAHSMGVLAEGAVHFKTGEPWRGPNFRADDRADVGEFIEVRCRHGKPGLTVRHSWDGKRGDDAKLDRPYVACHIDEALYHRQSVEILGWITPREAFEHPHTEENAGWNGGAPYYTLTARFLHRMDELPAYLDILKRKQNGNPSPADAP